MSRPSKLFFEFRQVATSFPILERVLIGNSLLIIVGAIGGTLLTRHLALIGNLNLILLFASLGILLTLLINYSLIRISLRPLRDLRAAVEQVKNGQTYIAESPSIQADPNTHQLVIAINSMLERLEGRTTQLRALSERVITAQEEERIRIARTLHDDTSQAMSILLMQLERLEIQLPEGHPDVKNRLMEARQLASQMLDDLRKNIWDLRPTILDDLGLIPAIRWYARMRLAETGVQIYFELGENIRLEPYLETMLFRITQEAVSNILHHADAQTVIIRLNWGDSHVCLQVEDDGRGFDVHRMEGEAVSRKQLGLLGIRERASLVGGEVKIDSEPGLGTCVQVCIPHLKRTGDLIEEPQPNTAE